MDPKNNNNINIVSQTYIQKILSSRLFQFIKKIFSTKKETVTEEKKIRRDLSEKKIDKMIKDSFPASD
jgi:hypothetical protein